MIGTDWSDPTTLWLNILNAGLGIACVLCYLAVGWVVVEHLWRRRREAAR